MCGTSFPSSPSSRRDSMTASRHSSSVVWASGSPTKWMLTSHADWCGDAHTQRYDEQSKSLCRERERGYPRFGVGPALPPAALPGLPALPGCPARPACSACLPALPALPAPLPSAPLPLSPCSPCPRLTAGARRSASLTRRLSLLPLPLRLPAMRCPRGHGRGLRPSRPFARPGEGLSASLTSPAPLCAAAPLLPRCELTAIAHARSARAGRHTHHSRSGGWSAETTRAKGVHHGQSPNSNRKARPPFLHRHWPPSLVPETR
jgi:hypothetical protein